MIYLYPEQLVSQLHGNLRACYLIMGNEPLLLQESFDLIRQQAKQHAFTEYFNFVIDTNTDWKSIFTLSQTMSLFSNRKIISLIIPENGMNIALDKKLNKFITLLHSDILLIIRSNKITQAQKNTSWYKILNQKALIIICETPNQTKLPAWVAARAKKMNFQLDHVANQIICSCYEGNLLALSQMLELLLLLYPDGNLTLKRVKEVVNNATHFYPFHWIESILLANIKRAWQILQQLYKEDIEPIILLRIIQREVLLLVKLKSNVSHTPLLQLFDNYKVWQNRRILLMRALKGLNLQQLYQAIHLLSQIEMIIKQDHDRLIWEKLEYLTLLLCGTLLPESILNAE